MLLAIVRTCHNSAVFMLVLARGRLFSKMNYLADVLEKSMVGLLLGNSRRLVFECP